MVHNNVQSRYLASTPLITAALTLRGFKISVFDDSREWFPDILPRLQASLQPPDELVMSLLRGPALPRGHLGVTIRHFGEPLLAVPQKRGQDTRKIRRIGRRTGASSCC